MAKHQFQFGTGTGGAALPVKVVPRASRNEIVGVSADGTLKIRVTAPPVDGAANEAVIELLAKALNLPKSSVEIVAGLTNTSKIVSLLGMDPALVDAQLGRDTTPIPGLEAPTPLAVKARVVKRTKPKSKNQPKKK
jgi:uncharacterized protein